MSKQVMQQALIAPTPMVHQCCGRDICDGTGCPNSGPWYKVPKWRMNAYHYGFTPTGAAVVDKILSAVACSGKAYHHTEDWRESNPAAREPHADGKSCQDWIQTAANEAAAALREAIAAPDAALKAAQPVARIRNLHGDSERFAERGLELLVDIQLLPNGTVFYTQPVPAAPYQVTTEDVFAACKAWGDCPMNLFDSMRAALQAHEARKVAA